MQGRVFLGQASEPSPAHLFFTRDRVDDVSDRIRTVRDHRYTYIRNFAPEAAEELYDTETDPHELVNLADRPEHVAR